MDILGLSGAMLLENALHFVSEHVVAITCTVTSFQIIMKDILPHVIHRVYIAAIGIYNFPPHDNRQHELRRDKKTPRS